MRYRVSLAVLLTLLAGAAAQDCRAVFAESAGTTARLGGLFRVHDPGTGDEKCGDMSLKGGETVEAMLFAVDKLSQSNQNLVEGVTFDVQIYDTCGREDEAAKSTLELVGFAEPENINFGYDATTCPARDQVFVGLVGPSLSQSAISASEVLTPVQVPVISPTATSIELDDKEKFPHFMRTASSDKSQAQAMVELLVVLGWTYVSTVASADSYGRMGIAEFTRAAKEAGICVAVSTEVSNTASGQAYFGPILNQLITKAEDGAVGVVAFLHDFNFQRIMEVAVSEGDRAKVLTWIVSEGVGPDQTVVQGHGSHARGMVTLRPSFSVIQEFQQHMETQHAVNRRGINPWFPEYYMELNQCRINHRSIDYTARKYVRFATLEVCDSFIMSSGFNQTFVASKTIDAVYAFAYAMRAAQADLCGPNPSGLCDDMRRMTQEEFFRYLQDVYFTGLGGNTVRFDETGNVEAAYDLFNYVDSDNDGEGDTFNRIGTYQGETLDVALMNITMYDQSGAEGVPDSDCLRDCSRCRPLKEDKKYAYLSGDVLVNGLFPVHSAGDTTFVCGDINREKGVQTLEAFLYAIRRINQDANLLPSVSLGTLVLDTCYTSIQASQDVSNLQSRVVTYGDVDVYDIIGYVGALSSDVTLDVADVLTSLGIPQISWGSTSTLLSNADDYPFFLRTVPSDDLQGEAVAALVDYFGWNYVATVSSDTVYGRSGITAFQQAADNYDICISFNHVVPRDATNEQLDAIITALRENTRARAVVSFVTDSDARALLQAATRLNARGELIWIGSDSWGNQASVVDGLENAARGALTITLENNPVTGFEDYFKALTPDSNSDNPWFKEFWEDYFGCNLPGGTKYADNCSPSHSLTQSFQQASFVPQVMNAVYAFAHGLDVLLREHCSGAQGVCSELAANENFKQLLLEKVKEQEFTGADGQPVQFNEDGSVTMGFTIWNYVRVRPGVYEYKDVGSFEGGALRLDRLSSAVRYGRDGTERFLSDFGSECRDFKICPGCTSLKIPDFFASGDDNTVVVPALFPIHAAGETSFECGAMRDTAAVQYLEAFLYAMDTINRRDDLLASATLGTIILDTCSSSDKAASQVLRLHNNELSGSNGDPANSTNIMAYVGGKEDDITKAVAGVLSPLTITQVTYGSTGSIFNDRGVFPTLLRTVPSNEQQAVVMVSIMKEFGWSYASVVHTSGAYGSSGKNLFVQTARDNGVCVATILQIPGVRTNDAMDKIIEELRAKKGATAVAVFADAAATRALLQAADRAATAGEFVWFGGNTWGTSQDVTQGLGFVSRGAFTLVLKSDTLAGFDTYFRTLRPSSNTRNPWFSEYWEETFGCYLTEKDPSYPPRPSCTGAERLEDSWVHDTFASYTATALFSIAYGLTRLATEVCGSATFCEGLLNHPDRQALTIQYVKNVSFTELGLSHVFTEQGAGQPNYVVMNYQRDGNNYHYTQVGSYSGDTLTLSRLDVRMYDRNGDVVTPTSKCIENCNLCLTEAARVDERFLLVTEDVDVLVAGVFPVHEAGDGIFTCGDMSQAGFELLEAFLFAIDRVNDDGTLLTNVKLGPFAMDSCSSSMRASRDVSNFYSRSVTFQNSLDPPALPNDVIGYVAEETDDVTVAVANQITPFNVVNVAYGASGVELGNANIFPYVLRTVPSDLRQANAILSIVQRFGWSYVSVVLSDNTYGRTLSQEFARISKVAGVCIATTQTIGTTATAGDLSVVVTALKTKLPGAVGLVLFTSAEDTRRFLEALTASNDAAGAFILVTGTKWGDLLSVARGFEVAARGAITLTIPASPVSDWQTYFEDLQPGSYFRNPWFNEFWNDHFQCDFSNTQDRKYDSTCLGTERLNFGANGLAQELYVPYVIDAVYGIANGLHSLLVSTCGTPSVCQQFRDMSNVGPLLREELTKIRFAGANARQFGFTETGDGNARYNVLNYQRRVDGSYGFVEVGSYTSAALDLNVANVRVYNRPGQVLTQIPRSACNGTCFECLDESFPNRCTNGSATAGSAAVVDGDIFVAGLFPMHDKGHDVYSCGGINEWEMQLFEAYMFALDRINADPSILPSVRLGSLALDTCESARKASRDIANFLSGEKTYYVTEYSSTFVEPASTLAVIGASVGDVSLSAMEVVETFKMAQVSYASPEIPMAARDNYGYFLRTIPALERQVQALMDMASYFKWKYVSVLYTPTVYGTVLFESFKEEAKTRGICLAVQKEIRNNFTQTSYDDVIVELRRKGEASTVILFTERAETENVLLAAQRVNVRSFYTWIVTTKVASDVDVPLAQDPVINGAVLLKVETQEVPEFDTYLETLTPETNQRNPWFKEFWQEHFQCNLPNEPVKYPVVCSGSERLTESSLTRNPAIVHVIRAVYAVAHGLDTTRKFYCPTEPEVCDNFRNANDKPERAFGFVRDVDLIGIAGSRFRFTTTGDGDVGYEILNYEITAPPSRYGYVKIGTWSDGLFLERSPQSTSTDNVKYPASECTGECAECVQQGILPAPPQERRIDVPTQVRTRDVWAIICMTLAALGMFLTLMLMIYFLVKVRSSSLSGVTTSTSLGYLILFGLFAMYAMVLPFVMTPNDVVCGVRRFGLGFFYAMTHGAILVKTIRIWRMSRMEKAGMPGEEAKFTRNWSNVFIVCTLLLPQVAIGVSWLLASPPATYSLGSTIYCGYSRAGLLFSLLYVMFLVFLTVIYSFVARNYSMNMWEARYIIAMTWLCVCVWISWACVYMLTDRDFWDPAVCVGLLLIATFILILLFVPKLQAFATYHHSFTSRYDINKRPNSIQRSDVETDSLGSLDSIYGVASLQDSAVTADAFYRSKTSNGKLSRSVSNTSNHAGASNLYVYDGRRERQNDLEITNIDSIVDEENESKEESYDGDVDDGSSVSSWGDGNSENRTSKL